MPTNLRPTLDRGTIASSNYEMGLAMLGIADQLKDLIRFDTATSTFSFDDTKVRQKLVANTRGDIAESLMTGLKQVSNGGMAVYGAKGDVRAKRALAIPWVVLSDVAYLHNGLPAEFRSALRLNDSISTSDDVVRKLRRSFQNVPDWITQPQNSSRFLRATPKTPSLRGRGRVVPAGDRVQPPGTENGSSLSQGLTAPGPEAIQGAVDCLLGGSWGPLGGNWWGWALGWQVCLGTECATKLADLLKGMGGAPALSNAVAQTVATGTIAAGVKALAATAGLALAVYGLVLGLNISLVNSERGVCIQGNWPTIPGLGAFIWAVPR